MAIINFAECSREQAIVERLKAVNVKHELVSCIEVTGFPVVAKICSPDILHKSDIGGVKVNVKNMEEFTACTENLVCTENPCKFSFL